MFEIPTLNSPIEVLPGGGGGEERDRFCSRSPGHLPATSQQHRLSLVFSRQFLSSLRGLVIPGAAEGRARAGGELLPELVWFVLSQVRDWLGLTGVSDVEQVASSRGHFLSGREIHRM